MSLISRVLKSRTADDLFGIDQVEGLIDVSGGLRGVALGFESLASGASVSGPSDEGLGLDCLVVGIGPADLFKELDGSIEHLVVDFGSSGSGPDPPHDSVKGLCLL